MAPSPVGRLIRVPIQAVGQGYAYGLRLQPRLAEVLLNGFGRVSASEGH
jgi:hypothetical protein